MISMELHLIFQTALTVTFPIVAIIFLYQMLSQKMTKSSKIKSPPQAKGAWPIIGHLHLLGGSELPHIVLGRMADECGPIFTIKLGVYQILVVSDHMIAKECFTKNDKVFASRPKILAAELMAYNYAGFGVSPYGDYWKHMRKMVIAELLSHRNVEMLRYIRVQEVRASMKDIFESWVTNKKSAYADMARVEMKELFGNLILNIIGRAISGKRFSPNDDEAVRVHRVVRKFFELCGTFVVSDYIPYVKFLDLGGHEKAMKVSAMDLDNILEDWLDEHKKRRETGLKGECKPDFMDVLISILEGSCKDEFQDIDCDTIIKATAVNILVAGLDTTTVTLTWALSLLLNNPQALKKAQDEIDEHVGRKRLVEESDMKNLVYLEAIIKETFRLYPPGQLSVPHESMDDCVLAEYNIPKGTGLLINLWKLHRDSNIWSDPNQFRPERFLTSQRDMDIKGQNYELLPFGSGRRMCPGLNFALKSLYLTLASLLQGFELMKPSTEPIDMTASVGLTNMKKTPLEVLLSPRLPIHMYHAADAPNDLVSIKQPHSK